MKPALPRAINLFGDAQPLEPADVRPDLRLLPTLADELRKELQITARIQRDPFTSPFPFTPVSSSKYGVTRHHGLTRDFRKAPAPESLAAACKRLASGGAAAVAWVKERRAVLGYSNLEVIA